MATTLEQQLRKLGQGDHVCPIHDRETELVSVAVPFICEGIARKERCLYAVDSPTIKLATEALHKANVRVAEVQSAGALVFLDKKATYLPTGHFDPQAMIAFLREQEAQALARGYSGVRYAGDMTWALEPGMEPDRLIAYEALLNKFLKTSRAVILCHYCRPSFDPALLHDILRTHPTVILGDHIWSNPYYEPPELLLSPEKEIALDYKRRRVNWWIERLQDVMTMEQARARAEADLVQTREELLRISRVSTIGEIASSIAHEINQPLTAVVTNAEVSIRWLDRDPPNLAEIREAMTEIVRDGHRAAAVIQRIRALMQKQEAEYIELNVNELVEETLELVERELKDHHVSARTDLDSSLAPVHGDRIQLQQCLLNLLINAVEAMEATPADMREVTVATVSDGGDVLITVTDTGPGIGQAQTGHLFDPFFTTKKGGVGLGLSICRTIIEAHGGRISAFSSAPSGTQFQVRLPGLARQVA
ncbi:MAG: MEDS domain-containing protein [Rhodospirillaceae bacterium]